MSKKINLSNADRVTKAYLIDHLVIESSFTRLDATKAVEGVIDAVVEALRAGADVNLSNVGTLRHEARPEQNRRNPSTGEYFLAPASYTVRWTPSPTLLDVLNGRGDRESLSRKAPKGSL